MDAPISIEIPSSTEHLQDLEKDLNQINGVEAELIKSKSVLATVLLTIAIVKGGMDATKIISEVAKNLYNFLHRKDHDKDDHNKKVVVVTKGGQRIEIDNLSIKEIEDILAKAQ